MRTLAAILALAPVLVSAQTKSPAQPESTPVLRSSLTQPVSPLNLNPANRVTPAILRISTGPVAPRLLHTVAMADTSSRFGMAFAENRSAVVQLTVGTDGVPKDIKIVQTYNPAANRDLIAAIQEFRYAPGTLNGQPVDFSVTLNCNIQHVK